jgi:hypothetical protein
MGDYRAKADLMKAKAAITSKTVATLNTAERLVMVNLLIDG